MLTLKEHAEINTLYRKYVSARRAVNILELYGCVRRETQNAEKGIVKVSRELLRELRADRARVGYLAHKTIGRGQLRQPFAPYADYGEWMLNTDFSERSN